MRYFKIYGYCICKHVCVRKLFQYLLLYIFKLSFSFLEDKVIDRDHDRIKLKDNLEKGIPGAYLEIENTQMSDRGEYFCSANNIVTIATMTNGTEANTFVRVKGNKIH